MKYLITGGCGFLGSNLAGEVIKRGEKLVVFDNLSRVGSEKNLAWLKSLADITFINGDIRNVNDVERLIQNEKPDVIFHLAGQVAMTTSISDPRKDFEINALGTFNILNSVKSYCPKTTVIYSSTNKVYGDLETLEYEENDKRYTIKGKPKGLDESTQLCFASPYGCSKGSADQYMLDFHRIFKLNTVVFRHSSMYGGRQFSTYDQGWIGWFCEQALNVSQGKLLKPFTISGDGKQVRDVLHADDMIELYFMAASKIDTISGEVFNIGGGQKNSLSLLELFDVLESELHIKLKYEKLPPRESDQKVFIADISKAERIIGWKPKVDAIVGIRKMLQWVETKD
jgi:CDP-paratose 2-epimerase